MPAATEAPAEPDAETPEVVEPGAELVREETPSQRAANDAIVAASEAAINNPGIPGRDEFLALAMQARILSMSGAAPKLVRGNPHLAFHVAMIGRDLGISPSAALELIDVIDGRNGPQLSLSPQLLNGQIRRLGLGSIVPVIKTNRRCVAVALGPDGFYDPRCKPLWPDHHELCECTIRAFLGESQFTWEDAQMAGLAGPDCEPGNHSARCKNGDRPKCNQGYVTYPQRMMWWRAGGFLADDIFPEASLGLYSPEALGAVVDADGRPVDPAAVELPQGYEPAQLPPAPAKETAPPADAEVLADLRIRVAALPDEQRATYREKWLESARLRGFTLDNLPGDRLTLATSMLVGFEKIAARDGWDADAARAEVLARKEHAPTATETGPQDAPGGDESPDGGEGQESPGEPQSEPQGQDDGEPGERPGPDPEMAAWVRAVSDVADQAQPGLVATVVAEVKAMHHAVVNRELTERGFEPGDHHIDTRRMVLTAMLVEARLHPEHCRMWRCEDPAGDDGTCRDHTPF